MYVIKPRFHKRLNLTQLMDQLNYEKIDSLINQMAKKKCVVRFPKMELKNKIDLRAALETLGANAMFIPGVANFAIMLENNKNSNDTEDNFITRMNSRDVEPRSLREIVDRLANPGVHVDSVMHEVKMTIDGEYCDKLGKTTCIKCYLRRPIRNTLQS
jgi:hypothetical protein